MHALSSKGNTTMRIFSRLTWGRRRMWGTAAGVSATEAAMIVSAVSVLGTMAAPAVTGLLADAMLAKARNDVRVIAVATMRFVDDVKAGRGTRGTWTAYDLLVTQGAVPAVGAGGGDAWAVDAGPQVGWLDDHLMTNQPAYERAGAGPSLGRPGWRGPYLETRAGADPWGHRYAVNVGMLRQSRGSDTIVLSAGPNGLIETPFDVDGIVAGGDDILAVVSTGQ